MLYNVFAKEFLKNIFGCVPLAVLDYENILQAKFAVGEIERLYCSLERLKHIFSGTEFVVRVLLISTDMLQVLIGTPEEVYSVYADDAYLIDVC